jgi:hypothetical protein
MMADKLEIREVFPGDLELMHVGWVGAIVLHDKELDWLRRYTEGKVFANARGADNCFDRIPSTRKGSLPDCFISGAPRIQYDSLSKPYEAYPVVFYEEIKDRGEDES